jgi:hypothetical protein
MLVLSTPYRLSSRVLCLFHFRVLSEDWHEWVIRSLLCLLRLSVS